MKYWIWLASVEGLGPVKKFALLNKFETAKRIYNATEKEILKVDGMSDKIVQNMQKAKDAKLLEKYEKSLMVIKSISKSCGLPGLRISVVASGNAAVISEIRQRICQWNINSVAEFALQIFSKYESDYKDSCLKFKKERKRFVKVASEF